MLRIKQKDIYPEKSDVLFRAEFTPEAVARDFEITGGEWICENGGITGFFPGDNGGILYTKEHFYGNVMLDFYARTIPPYYNDINFTFCADGWDFEKDAPKPCYIGGLSGWWVGKAGLERFPTEENFCALTGMHRFEPGREYHIQTGRVENMVFLCVDGALAVEVEDPRPITEFGRVGLDVYATKVFYRDFRVLRPYWEPYITTYSQLHAQRGIHAPAQEPQPLFNREDRSKNL